MSKEILQSIPGVSTWAMLALILFFIVFIGIVVWAFFRIDKTYLKHMQELPLDSGNSITQGD